MCSRHPSPLVLRRLSQVKAPSTTRITQIRIPSKHEIRISTNISWGTPSSPPIETIFDTGSIGFWVYGPDAQINDGSTFLGAQGPCNYTASPAFNWPNSSTHTQPRNVSYSYSYGGNSKMIYANKVLNDTMRWQGDKDFRPIENVQVAIADFSTNRAADPGCKGGQTYYEHSIMGMGPFGVGSFIANTGPSFTTNLFSQGQISRPSFSIWFSKPPKSIQGTYTGVAVFGEIPAPFKKDLIRVPLSPPGAGYVGYYIAAPTATASGKNSTKAMPNSQNVTHCLLDSGTGTDNLPFSSADIGSINGVFNYIGPGGVTYIAYNGSCDSIPEEASFEYTFSGPDNKTKTISAPVKNYVRGIYDSPENVCPLSLNLDSPGDCVLGSPFFSAAFLNFDEEAGTVGIAQGGREVREEEWC